MLPRRPLRDSWMGNRKFRNSFIDKVIADFLEEEITGIVSSAIKVTFISFQFAMGGFQRVGMGKIKKDIENSPY